MDLSADCSGDVNFISSCIHGICAGKYYVVNCNGNSKDSGQERFIPTLPFISILQLTTVGKRVAIRLCSKVGILYAN